MFFVGDFFFFFAMAASQILASELFCAVFKVYLAYQKATNSDICGRCMQISMKKT